MPGSGSSSCPEDGKESVKRIVVGLGNPGSRYERTRHNIGWMVLDRLADRHGVAGRARERDAAATVRARLGDDELLLVKPLTYMNASGDAVRRVLARERVPLGQVLVVVDDMDLPFGRLRLKARGSAGGHNGLRSIIGEMGTDTFSRLRVGIGAPKRGAIDHVLGDFEHAEQSQLEEVLAAAADAVDAWATRGVSAAADGWNGWRLEASPEREPRDPGAGGPASKPPLPSMPKLPLRSEPHTPDQEAPHTPDQDALHTPLAPGQAGQEEPLAPTHDEDGIVRTRRGWRKLLPEFLSGRDDPGRGDR
jgi:PTH1 family peptidyl-tRNA hydrolase